MTAILAEYQHFNSQPHKEADLNRIHCRATCGYFNSQPHKEADWDMVRQKSVVMAFQLTASQGG